MYCSYVTQSLGSVFGKSIMSPSVKADFERESKTPNEIFVIHYDTRENLEKRGIKLHKQVYITPSAFPGEDTYCPIPNK
jgi:hypothetical protein